MSSKVLIPLCNIGSVFHLYLIRTCERFELIAYLWEKGISIGLQYPIQIHLQRVYKQLNHKSGDFPISKMNAENYLSLLIYSELKTEQINYVCKSIHFFINEK